MPSAEHRPLRAARRASLRSSIPSILGAVREVERFGLGHPSDHRSLLPTWFFGLGVQDPGRNRDEPRWTAPSRNRALSPTVAPRNGPPPGPHHVCGARGSGGDALGLHTEVEGTAGAFTAARVAFGRVGPLGVKIWVLRSRVEEEQSDVDW